MPDQLAVIADLIRSQAPFARRVDAVMQLLRQPRAIESAVWHPYGFVACRLGRVDGGTLRLHLWPAGERTRQEPDWPIHNHIFRLDSTILAGELTNHDYQVSASGRDPLYRVRYHEGQSILTRSEDQVDAVLVRSEVQEPEKTYLIEPLDYHASEVPTEVFAATIVLTSKHVDDAPAVVGAREGRPLYAFTRRPCDDAALAALVEELRRRVGTG